MVDPVGDSWQADQLSARRAALVIHGAVSRIEAGDRDNETRGNEAGRRAGGRRGGHEDGTGRARRGLLAAGR